MKPTILAAALSVLAALPLLAQEYEEVRFHRVYLKNGNFIDGNLVGQTDRDVTLKIRSGEITLRNELIASAEGSALRIEIVKIRSLKEKPAVVAPPPEKAPDQRRDPFVRPPPEKAPEKTPRTVETMETEASVKEQVDRILKRLAAADRDKKNEVIQDLLPLGEPAALYLASSIEAFPPASRGYVAAALSQMNVKKVLPVMRQLLKSPDAGLRAQAVMVIGSTGEAGDADILHPLIKDPDPMPRASAVLALQRLRNPLSLRPLAEACGDPEAQVRSRAIEALFDLAQNTDQAQDVYPTLQNALDKAGDAAARVDLIAAVGRAGQKDAWRILTRYLRDDNPGVRAQVLSSLSAMEATEAADDIQPRFEVERDDAVRRQLALAAQKLRIRRAVPHLIGWLEGEDTPTRDAVHQALRQLTGQRFPPEPAPWSQWWEKAKPPE